MNPFSRLACWICTRSACHRIHTYPIPGIYSMNGRIMCRLPGLAMPCLLSLVILLRRLPEKREDQNALARFVGEPHSTLNLCEICCCAGIVFTCLQGLVTRAGISMLPGRKYFTYICIIRSHTRIMSDVRVQQYVVVDKRKESSHVRIC